MTNPALPDSELMARLARALTPAYELVREIGRGGMAIVYEARDARLKRGVAVKLLPPDLAFRTDIRTRFLREAETAARLNHPNIVPIYAVDERDGLVYFVMALVSGESVGELLRRGGAMDVAAARRILREVADALALAHGAGVVHRDVKPDNILIDRASGRALVTDFGIARAVGDDGGGSRLTATGAAIGTPAYMSPEQCVGDREIDGRSDLYSLGAVAYQMLAGDPPFTGNNTPALMMKQVMELPMPLRERRSGVPEDLERIIMRLLEKDPEARFANGAELVAALDGADVPKRVSDGTRPRRTAFADTRRAARTRAVVENQALAPAEVVDRVKTDIDRMMERHASREQIRDARRELRRTAREVRLDHKKPPRSVADRLRAARNHLVSYVGASAMLFGINAMTGHGFWWCVFPIMGMGLGMTKDLGSLWADGIPLRSLLGGPLPSDVLPAGNEADRQQLAAVPNPALDGPHGAVLRQAVTDRRDIEDLLNRMSAAERARIPDVKPTADALYERIVTLAAALDRLDGQIDTSRGPALDERIAQIERQPGDGVDRERPLALLRRQRDMLADFVRSRATLLEQYESAGLLLENLSLDLLKVRSSGLDSAMSGIASATQEARALSREIGYVLSAADELRDLDGKAERES